MPAEASVLIVDDDPDICHLLMEEIMALGYDCDIAYNGDIGLAELHHHDYKIALLDINLPGVSGLEILQDLRDNHAKTKAVIISGLDQAEPASRAIKLGAVDYITKPFQLSRVHDLLIKILDGDNHSSAIAENSLLESQAYLNDCFDHCGENLPERLDVLAECIKKKLGDIVDLDAISIEQAANIAQQRGALQEEIDQWLAAKNQARAASGYESLEERNLLSKSLSSGLKEHMKIKF